MVGESSDSEVLNLLRAPEGLGIAELASATGVTATAVRQRLNRLMAQGLVCRTAAKYGRGRPRHRYQLTDKARRSAGTNFSDLAIVLWEEIRGIKDAVVRRGLLQRIARALADGYRSRVGGGSLAARVDQVVDLFAERRVEMTSSGGDLPVLTVQECPYPELAERDRGICAAERMMLSEMLESPVRLTQCRLEGHNCCQFETGSAASGLKDVPVPVS